LDTEIFLILLAEKLAIEYIPRVLAGSINACAGSNKTQAGSDIPEQLIRIVLEALIGAIHEEQNTFDEKLNSLIGKYYKDGTDLLYDAKHLQGERREEWIKKALFDFNSASNVEIDPVQKTKSLFFVGVCYDLLNESTLALQRYEKAYGALQLTSRRFSGSEFYALMISLEQVLRAHGSTLNIPKKADLQVYYDYYTDDPRKYEWTGYWD
jgi:hypothetical protein